MERNLLWSFTTCRDYAVNSIVRNERDGRKSIETYSNVDCCTRDVTQVPFRLLWNNTNVGGERGGVKREKKRVFDKTRLFIFFSLI